MGALSRPSTHVEGGEKGVIAGSEPGYGSKVRKRLAFGEASPVKRLAPSAPAGVRRASVGVIDISDSDDETDQGNTIMSTDGITGSSMDIKKSDDEIMIKKDLTDPTDEEEMGGDGGSSLFTKTAKRKRAANIVTSDTEEDCNENEFQPELDSDFQPNTCSEPATDSGDNVQKSASKRRLVSLRNLVSTPKSKRASHNVASDNESEHYVDAPRCKSKTILSPDSNSEFQLNSCSIPATISPDNIQESATRSRRLASLRKFEEKWLQKSSQTMPTTEIDSSPSAAPKADSEDVPVAEESASESEGDSLGGFIVDESDVSEDSGSSDGSSKNSDSGDASGVSQDISDDNYGELMSKLGRKRGPSLKWELEGHMLADFGKDPELCMKAVCVLYRQQTSEEKGCKVTIYSNQRGFSQCDAHRLGI